jgi:hypothetical protein
MRKEIENWGDWDTPFQRLGCEPLHWNTPKHPGVLTEMAGGHLGFFGYLFIVRALLSLSIDYGDFEEQWELDDFRWRKLYDDRVHPNDAVLEVARFLLEFYDENEIVRF